MSYDRKLEEGLTRLRAELDAPVVSTPRRRSALPRLVALTAAGGLLAVVLWPRTEGAAWAQVAAKLGNDAPTHIVGRNREGAVQFEQWRDDLRFASMIKGSTGKVMYESRTDGERRFTYVRMPATKPLSPNRLEAATLKAETHSDAAFARRFMGEFFTLAAQLKQPGVKAKGPRRVTTPNGERDRYELTIDKKWDSWGTVIDVEPGSGRVTRILDPKSGYTHEIGYSTAIPKGVFAPRASYSQPDTTYVVPDQEKVVESRLRSGLGQKEGIVLRLALLDRNGSLWLFWTGAAPDGRMSRPFRVPGVRLGPAYGPSAFTTTRKGLPPAHPSPVTGTWLDGMSRATLDRIGSEISVEVPGKAGYVRFDHVPVLRVADMYDFGKELGIHGTY